MRLKDCQFELEYRSGHHNLIRDLYHRALPCSRRYWRAVGYFSSSALEAVGSPLGEFFFSGGRVRLATSVELRPDDFDAINAGQTRQSVCEERVLAIIREDFQNAVGKGTALLAALLEFDRLELRICVPTKGTGIYHEKVGVFRESESDDPPDSAAVDDGDFVAFSGSSNESRPGLELNYESVDVYTSWNDPERAANKFRHFRSLWSDDEPGVKVYPFPEAARRELIRLAKEHHPELFEPNLRRHNGDDKWRHQREAVAEFLEHRRGVLEMATGTGKTKTALQIFEVLANRPEIDALIVTAEGLDLLEQWCNNILAVISRLTRRFRLLRHFGAHHGRQEFVLSPQRSILVISRSRLDSVLRGMSKQQLSRVLLVHDEVHGLGSPGNISSLDGLSADVPYRLGLSATPEREYDAAGNAFIERNVGPIIFTFPLEKAIKRGILCEFDYFPLEYSLTKEDRQELQDVHRRAAAREAAGTPMTQEEIWTALARIPKRSKAKLPLFSAFLRQHPEILHRCLIFVEDRAYGEHVLEIVHAYQHDFHTYYAADERETLLDFAKGRIECLVTCERLSEGVDIQSVRSIVLFSADRARLQTIQRIGRCLRTDPSDPAKRSVVVDFVRAQAPDESEPNADKARAGWLSMLSTIRRETSDGTR
jgi:superfamily II DNA or RNA helicase